MRIATMRAGSSAVFFAALSLCLCTRPPAEQWTRTFGPSDDTVANCVQLTRDKGFIVAGTMHNMNDSEFHEAPYLLKLDSAGHTLWLKYWWKDPALIQAYVVHQTADGGYVVSGFGWDTARATILKTDSLGNQQWMSGVRPWAQVNDIRQTRDGGFIAGGDWVPEDSLYFMKLDSLGKLEWRRTCFWKPVPMHCGEPSEEDWGFRTPVRQTRDGGYVLARLALYKTDSAGSLVWKRDYGRTMLAIHDMEQTSDGGYITTGVGQLGGIFGNLIFIRGCVCSVALRTDSVGTPKWKKVFVPSLTSLTDRSYVLSNGRCIVQTKDGGYVMGGSLQTTTNKWTGHLVKTDRHGNQVWSMILKDWPTVRICRQTPDGGYIIGDGDKHIMKLAPDRAR
jgi:hypothetical protein